MATTTNFGWETPDDTDLVKDGALAMRTLGNSIDSSFVDLKGGTTGQVLAKASNTDLDYTWVTQDDANAIQNAIVDAKGDLIAASAADTPARLAVGNNGDTLVADSSTSTGLRWQGNFAAGKNKVINGDFVVNQRNFSSTTSSGYTFDRWNAVPSGGTVTYSAQTFTGGSPVSGYEGRNFIQIATTGQSAASHFTIYDTPIEDVRILAGQTATISFWARAASGTPKIAFELNQNFGAGGTPSPEVVLYGGNVTISNTWNRYSLTVNIPSLSGKTFGTVNPGGFLNVRFWLSAGSDWNSRTGSIGLQNSTISLWGVQLEAGSVATPFTTATGTLQGELAACQRYYQRLSGSLQNQCVGVGVVNTSTRINSVSIRSSVTMRTSPTLSYAGTITGYDGTNATSLSSFAVSQSAPDGAFVDMNFTGASFTTGRAGIVFAQSSGTNYFEMSAEL